MAPRVYNPRSKALAKRITNAPVKTIYKRRAKNTKVDKNKSAIMTLSRQVKSLQLSKIGLYQKAWQNANVGPGFEPVSHGWTNKVLFMALNDFSPYAALWRGEPEIDPLSDNYNTPKTVQISNWATWVPSQNSASGTQMHNRYNYWFNSQDVVSPVAYLPISTRVTMQFEIEGMPANAEPVYIRYQVIRQKKQLLHTTAHALNLPTNMASLAGMALDSKYRNRINREYFHIHQDKWIKMSNANDVTKNVKRTLVCTQKFPSKVLKVEGEHPVTSGTAESDNVLQGFTTNIRPTDVYYLVIHTSRNLDFANGERLSINFNRFISWRDQHGVAA